jgi:hypothetical protein
MVELELVGLSEDRTSVVLADAAGAEFAVPLDDRLRAMVRGDVRTRQLETPMQSAQTESAQAESALRPRDIQARLRAGESPEAVAEIAQVSVDRIRSYAVPVLAERAHMADRARRSAVRRKQADGPGRMLGDAVAERLRADGVDPDTCEWDAWRRDDGRWTVAASYRGADGERTGTFVYDALSRYALPDDDDARWLVGERTESRGRDSGGRSARRRLSAVASEYDAMLFDDEIPTADLTAVADVLGDQAVPPEDADPAGDAPGAEPEARPALEAEEPAAEESHERPRQETKQQPKPEKRGRRGRGRASVPSWDEIMFGQSKG